MLINSGYTKEEPTVRLRFMHGRLQQLWVTRTVTTNMETVENDWRDVPDATPQPPVRSEADGVMP